MLYRIRRSDRRNIVIERKAATDHPRSKPGSENWTVVAYCGNSVNALLRELSELVTGKFDPENEGIVKELRVLSKVMEEGYQRVETAIRERGDLEL